MSNRWTSEQDATLKSMLADGKHYFEIAEALNKTRNSCIGRGHRLGIQVPDLPERNKRGGIRRRKFDHDEIRSLRRTGLSYAKIAKRIGCSVFNAWHTARLEAEGEEAALGGLSNSEAA